MHQLDPQKPHHLWLLHVLFLDNINQECLDFQEEWNCHPISGLDTNNKSPKVHTLSTLYVDLMIVILFKGHAFFGPNTFWDLL